MRKDTHCKTGVLIFWRSISTKNLCIFACFSRAFWPIAKPACWFFDAQFWRKIIRNHWFSLKNWWIQGRNGALDIWTPGSAFEEKHKLLSKKHETKTSTFDTFRWVCLVRKEFYFFDFGTAWFHVPWISLAKKGAENDAFFSPRGWGWGWALGAGRWAGLSIV